MIEVKSWAIIKAYADKKKLPFQCIETNEVYQLFIVDGPIVVSFAMDKHPSDKADLEDFESNYKRNSNIPINPSATLKMAKAKSKTEKGEAILLIKVPGDPLTDSRIIQGGMGWWDSSNHFDDSIEVYVTDEDNLLGLGAGSVVGGYTDTDVPEENRGWYFVLPEKLLRISALAGIDRLKAGLYLKIIAKTGNNREDTFRCNLEWGDPANA